MKKNQSGRIRASVLWMALILTAGVAMVVNSQSAPQRYNQGNVVGVVILNNALGTQTPVATQQVWVTSAVTVASFLGSTNSVQLQTSGLLVSPSNPLPVQGKTSIRLDIPDALTETAVNITGSGATTLFAGTSAKVSSVFKVYLMIGGQTNLTIYDTSGTPVTVFNTTTFGGGSSLTLDETSNPWWETSSSQGLILNSSSAVSITGRIYYLAQ